MLSLSSAFTAIFHNFTPFPGQDHSYFLSFSISLPLSFSPFICNPPPSSWLSMFVPLRVPNGSPSKAQSLISFNVSGLSFLPSFPLALVLQALLADLCDPVHGHKGMEIKHSANHIATGKRLDENMATFGPEIPCGPGCPWRHLHVALPLWARRPSSACPPHCRKPGEGEQ